MQLLSFLVDPHFNTLTGHHFSYHGQCDLIMMESPQFMSGLGLTIHIRTTRVDSFLASYSYISEIALRFGKDVVQVQSDGQLLINGMENTADLVAVSEAFSVQKSLTGKKKLIVNYDLNLGAKNLINIRANLKTHMLFMDVSGNFPDSVGLLGSTDAHGVAQSLLSRDGFRNLEGEWNTLGEEWQVRDTDKNLFLNKRFPQYPEGCVYTSTGTGKDAEKKNLRRRLEDRSKSNVSIEVAKSACAHLSGPKQDFCVTDVMLTGDLDLAEDPFYV